MSLHDIAPPALQLTGVSKSFGRTVVLSNVDLDIVAGERHALIGPNGAGKSTLFDLISGRIPVSSGHVALHGQPVTGLAARRINRLGLARSFQISSVFARLSVFENVRCATLFGLGYRYSFWHRLARLRDAAERTMAVLEAIGLTARRDMPAGSLSYAEQRALEIGIVLASDPRVMLLDEPTAGMSRAESEQAVGMIRRVTAGRTLIMVEHDMDVVFGLADRVSVLVQGRLLATDGPAAIRANPAVQQAYLGLPAGRGGTVHPALSAGSSEALR